MVRKFLTGLILISFLFSSFNPLYAGSLLYYLPSPGAPVKTSTAFKPVMLHGIKVDPKNPFHLDFIINTGDGLLDPSSVKSETLKLVRYFLASLTVPNDQLWVNLSPYEKNRIIPDGLALTEMGGELLAQDYLLKQLSASLLGPEQNAGKKFWSQVSAVPLDIFNKIWIVPDRATIEEHNGTAVIVESHLKVMLEVDYLSLEKHLRSKDSSVNQSEAQSRGSMANSLIRELVLPQIEREVNEGQNFAGVRQVNNALILAAWFKQNLKQSLLGQKYVNRNKVSGIDLQDRSVKLKIYAQYLKAFQKGVYNFIKEDVDPQTQQVVARKYFLGGYSAQSLKLNVKGADFAQISEDLGNRDLWASVDLAMMAPKTDVDKDTAGKRLEEIKKSDYKGFPVVEQDKNIPVGVEYALAFYDQLPGLPNNPLRELIKAGKLRAGPDWQLAIKAIRDEDGVLVSTDSENEVDHVLIQLLSGDDLVKKFDVWKMENRSKALDPLSIHTSGVIAQPMEVLKRYGILDLLSRGVPLTMKEIIEHVRHLKVDGKTIKYNTPNRQYISGILRSLASCGWLNIQDGPTKKTFKSRFLKVMSSVKWLFIKGDSFNDQVEFTLTANGQEVLPLAEHYAQVADFMPNYLKITDYLFNRPNAPPLKEGALTLRQLADLSKEGWNIPETMKTSLVRQIKGQLDGYLVINFALALWEKKVFDLFDSNLEINIDRIKSNQNIEGNTDELKAAFDIFVNVGFLTDLGDGNYKMTQEGLVAFDRVLAYGVTVSYRPSYDLYEEFMFGDVNKIKRYDKDGNELLVYRYLNVWGSGAAHKTYFKQIDKIVQEMIIEQINNKEIPPPEEFKPDSPPFVLSFADTGCGDGTFLAHLYHLVMTKTSYGDLVRQYPKFYKMDMVGVDYNSTAQKETRKKLQYEEIPHTVMFGNINDPKQIVTDVKNALHIKYGQNAKTLVVHTRTFLDHNRPWLNVKNIIQATRRVSHSTGFYGWRGKAIPNKVVEQNLYEHAKGWYDALSSEGQKYLIAVELHTIPPELAAANVGRTLDVPYWMSHSLSDQFIIEYPIYKARFEEAGFVGGYHKLFPNEPMTTVSVDSWKIPTVNPAMVSKKRPMINRSEPFGGINLNPDLGFIRVERDAHGVELPQESRSLQNIDIEGIQPILLKITPISRQRLLAE